MAIQAAGDVTGWERCTTAGCGGARAEGHETCIGHLDAADLAALVAGQKAGDVLDARGVDVDAELLARMLAAASTDGDGRRRLWQARFDAATFFDDAVLDGLVFERDVCFDGAIFKGRASFDGCIFRGHARFAGVTFNGPASFSDAAFEGLAWFSSAVSASELSFHDTRFGAAAWFASAAFQADVSFERASVAADATFTGTAFGCHTTFAGSSFKGPARFQGATFARSPRFDGAAFEGRGGAPQAAARQTVWTGADLATYAQRAKSALVDVGIVLVILATAWMLASLADRLGYVGLPGQVLALGVACAIGFTLYNLTRQGNTGQTVGKAWTGVCLVRESNGYPIGVVRSLVRQVLHVIDTVPLFAGWAWPLFDAKRQTLADKVVCTVVVVRRAFGRPGYVESNPREVPAGFS